MKRSAYSGATRRLCQFSRGHALFFRTVPSAIRLHSRIHDTAGR